MIKMKMGDHNCMDLFVHVPKCAQQWQPLVTLLAHVQATVKHYVDTVAIHHHTGAAYFLSRSENKEVDPFMTISLGRHVLQNLTGAEIKMASTSNTFKYTNVDELYRACE